METVQVNGFRFKPCGELDEKFFKFHLENPHVYKAILKYAAQMKQAGCKKGSISLITERIRWDRLIRTSGCDKGYKISNDFRSRYSRLVELTYPQLFTGFFSKKPLDESCFSVPEEFIEKIEE